ncbi:MAG TPA: 50S ribosomal protein L6 [Sphingomonadales bacterium]
MSRIGKQPIPVPAGVTVAVNDNVVSVKGPKGELSMPIVNDVTVALEDGALVVRPKDANNKQARSMWGMQRTLLNNLVVGVTQGFTRELEITGVGYRAALRGRDLQLQLGFSHEVVFPVPADITVACPEPTKIVVSGINKQRVGEVAAKIRAYRKPEPYKGKGVKYAGEFIFRKEGKKK